MNLITEAKKKWQTLNGRVLLHAPVVETTDQIGSDPDSDENMWLDMEAQGITLAEHGQKAHLVGSETFIGQHKITLDIDFPCTLEPSATPGKYHLFIDKTISKAHYATILKALYEAGIIQAGVYKGQFMTQGMTSVRLPGIKKPVINKKTGDLELVVKPGSYMPDPIDTKSKEIDYF